MMTQTRTNQYILQSFPFPLTLVWFPSMNIFASERPLPFPMGGAENASRTSPAAEVSLSSAAVVPNSANSFTPSEDVCILLTFHFLGNEQISNHDS